MPGATNVVQANTLCFPCPERFLEGLASAKAMSERGIQFTEERANHQRINNGVIRVKVRHLGQSTGARELH